jgi:hypothetical protein
VWLLVVDWFNGLVDVGKRFCCFVLAFQDVLPSFFPCLEVFDKLWRVSVMLGRVHKKTGLTLSIISSAALKSAKTTETSAWSSDLF